MKYIKIPEIKH